MKKGLIIFTLAAVAIALVSSCVAADPSFFGTTGNLLTPNDTVLTPGQFSLNYDQINVSPHISFAGASFGVTDNLELGVTRFDSSRPGSSIGTMLNFKYSVLKETATAPSVVIGSVDTTGNVDVDGNPGLYIVLGKNVTPEATNISGQPMKPIRAYIGYGGGLYHGVFLAADWSFTEKAKIIAEYLSKTQIRDGFSDTNVLNAGLRLSITDALKADISLIKGSNIGFGLMYNKTM